jgi:phosphoribosylformimino-5-aminoimidazole carboxamide ribonucleotide (ProFAR) isomerase
MATINRTGVATLLAAALTASIAGCWSYVSDDAHERFVSRSGPFSVTLYPVHVMRGPELVHDAALAQALAADLEQQGLAKAVVAQGPIEYSFEGGHNEAKMAKHSAEAFAAQVRGAAITTDYALMVEVLANPGETVVIGVHYYLVERGGAIADGSLTNSHWEEFDKVRPHDRQGGLEVAKLMLRRAWSRPATKAAG